MKIIDTGILGVYKIENECFQDFRGRFVKIYNEDCFSERGIECEFKEHYYSVSNKNVIRGMHFQLPPYDHNKLVYVINGSAIDVILDLRKSSKTYKKHICVKLSSTNGLAMYIPKGCAHGFKALESETTMIYNVSSVYDNSTDSGVLWDSFGFDWKCENPIISDRDKKFCRLDDFNSPF